MPNVVWLRYCIIHKVQELSNPNCNIPLSELVEIDAMFLFFLLGVGGGGWNFALENLVKRNNGVKQLSVIGSLCCTIPVPFSFLDNSFATRMFASLLQLYTCISLNHFSEFRLSRSKYANLCIRDETIIILLGADFFNSPETRKVTN